MPSTNYTVSAIFALLLSLAIWRFEFFKKPSRIKCYQRIDTLSSANDSFTCICASGRSGQVLRLFNHSSHGGSGGSEAWDVSAGYVIPGLWDGHGHILQYGEMLSGVKLYGAESVDVLEIKTRIKEHLNQNPTHGNREKWIRGIGWDQENFGGVMPIAVLILMLFTSPAGDVVFVCLRGELMLTAFGFLVRLPYAPPFHWSMDQYFICEVEPVLNLLPKPFPEIPGGEVITNPGVGVFCDNAMDPVFDVWPRPGREEKIGFIEDAMKSLHSLGIVGVHDAGVLPTDVEILNDLADAGRLTLRFYAMLECPVRNTVCGGEARMVNREDGKLSVRSVKLFAGICPIDRGTSSARPTDDMTDGALGSWGAALLLPYSDKPNATGSMIIGEEDLYSVAKGWDDLGYQVNIHTIGDRANRAAITAFENILKPLCPQSPYRETCSLRSFQDEKRFRLEHAQIISPADQERLVSMGIIPSIQPTHATSDMAYALSRLGSERLAGSAYRMKSFYNAGLPVILGSDFPIEPPSPFAGIYAAMTRRSPEDGSSENNTCPECGWYPEEKITLQEALSGFGANVAWGGFMDGRGVGELKVGGRADWIVLDRDIWAVGEEGIRDAKVLETWVAGRRVWTTEGQPGQPGSWWRRLWHSVLLGE
ncbi:amidohydrolase family-domain-containing protein [Tuber brumale]|nr:amidohydrolase family-domain-containing protein [Tuber brumale]